MRYLTFLLTLLLLSSSAGAADWIAQWRAPALQSGQRLASALALCQDAQRQRFYVADGVQSQLHAFNAQGEHQATFEAGGQLGLPIAMTLQRSGRFWLVDRAANALVRIDLEAQDLKRLPFPLTGPQALVPEKIHWHSQAGLLILDRLSGGIAKLNDHVEVAQRYAPPGNSAFVDFACRGNQLWALTGDGRICSFALDNGQQQQLVRLQGELGRPVALALSPAEQLAVLDRARRQVIFFSRQGRRQYAFGSAGKRLGQFQYPRDLLFDSQGRLAVLDEGNRCLDMFAR